MPFAEARVNGDAMDTLAFTPAEDGLQLVINGKDLWDILFMPTGCGCSHLPFWYIARQPIDSVFDGVASGRKVLHVCCCGHESCGRLTAGVDVTADRVTWSALSDRGDCTPFDGIGPFAFDRAQYETVIANGRQLAEAEIDEWDRETAAQSAGEAKQE